MAIRTEQVSVTLGNSKIVSQVSIQINKGEFVGLIGPNGSGKSTFLKALYNVLKSEGDIFINGRSSKAVSLKELAKEVAVLIQENSAEFDFKVEEVVLMGRTPYKELFESDNNADKDIVKAALEKVNMLSFAKRSFIKLSGGEKQRVLIARALAQQAEIMILDEPTNHLDVRHQLQLVDIIRSLKLTIFSALHDLNIAAIYCDRIYVLNHGSIVADGKVNDVLTTELLRDVFGIDAIIHPKNNSKVYIEYIRAI